MSNSLPTPPAGEKYQSMEVAPSTNWDTYTVESVTGISITPGKTLNQFVADYFNTSIMAREYTCNGGEKFICVIVPESTADNSDATFNNPATGNYNVLQEDCEIDEGTLRPKKCKGGS